MAHTVASGVSAEGAGALESVPGGLGLQYKAGERAVKNPRVHVVNHEQLSKAINS